MQRTDPLYFTLGGLRLLPAQYSEVVPVVLGDSAVLGVKAGP